MDPPRRAASLRRRQVVPDRRQPSHARLARADGGDRVHVPQWRFDPSGAPANPDRMVFDLDPGEGMGLPECAGRPARARHPSAHGARGGAVTSGSKGIHLYAALDGSQTSEQVSAVAHELAKALEADHPDLIVSSMRKTLRSGRVLIDWSQNNGKKTTIAPYSLRGRFRRPSRRRARGRSWTIRTSAPRGRRGGRARRGAGRSDARRDRGIRRRAAQHVPVDAHRGRRLSRCRSRRGASRTTATRAS